MAKEEAIKSKVIVTKPGILDHSALLEPAFPFEKDEGDKQYTAQVFFKNKDALAKAFPEFEDICKRAGVTMEQLESTGIRDGNHMIKLANKPENKQHLVDKVVICPRTSEKFPPKLFKFEADGTIVKVKDKEEQKELFYRGAIVAVSFVAKYYKQKDRKTGEDVHGITLYLSNVIFVKHNEPLSGATGAEFKDIDVADLSVDENDIF